MSAVLQQVRVNLGVSATEYSVVTIPEPSRGKRVAILLPGAGVPNVWNPQTAFPKTCELGYALARAGIATLAIAAGSTVLVDSWANDSAMAAINAAITYAGAQIPGAVTDKVHLIGVSMGGGAGNRFAALNPGKVASWTGIISLASLFPIYANNNPAGSQAGIAAAWGKTSRQVLDAAITLGSPTLTSATAAFTGADVGAPLAGPAGIPAGTVIGTVTNGTTVQMAAGAAIPGAPVNATATASGQTLNIWAPLPNSGSPNADIISLAAAIRSNNIPAQEYYASNDPYITVADTLALAAASGAVATSVGALGHTDAAIGAVNAAQLIAFLESAGA